MEGQAISKDGTAIAFECEGSGPPLLLVHGTGGAATRWRPLLPVFGESYTAYAIDRRGRRESGDNPPYAIEREFEDIAAVARYAGSPANLLGHSFGGFCALGSALLASRMHDRAFGKLILYEPPIPLPQARIFPDGLIEQYEAMIATGDREATLTRFMREIVRMPPAEIETLRALPAWQARLAAAHTLPRELRLHVDYQFDAEGLAGLDIPVLLMIGSESQPFFRTCIDYLHETLPNSRVVVLAGQGHSAMDTAPELFAREVMDFLAE